MNPGILPTLCKKRGEKKLSILGKRRFLIKTRRKRSIQFSSEEK
jgi:hypothetical protein